MTEYGGYENKEAYEREMRGVEKRERLIRDTYNSSDPVEPDYNDVEYILTSRLDYAPHKGQSYIEYATEARAYAKIGRKKNWYTHYVKGARGKPFYSHSNPAGCFMCEDSRFIEVLVKALILMAQRHPDEKY